MKMNIIKAAALGGVLAMTATASYAASQDDYQLSSHILDIGSGEPAAGVKVKLMMQDKANGQWKLLSEQMTNDSGRINDFLPNEGNIDNDGIYKLIFETTPYFRNMGKESFFPYIEVNFTIEGDKHYHVPITLSQYGYSTYRGS